MTTANHPTTSESFCCRECGADVAIELSQGGELYYQCQNARCGKAVHVDCPQALATRPAPAPTSPTSPAARKAIYHLSQGVQLVRTAGGWLVPSGSRAAVIHQVDDSGRCSCEAGQHGRHCWHVEAAQLVTLRRAA